MITDCLLTLTLATDNWNGTQVARGVDLAAEDRDEVRKGIAGIRLLTGCDDRRSVL